MGQELSRGDSLQSLCLYFAAFKRLPRGLNRSPRFCCTCRRLSWPDIPAALPQAPAAGSCSGSLGSGAEHLALGISAAKLLRQTVATVAFTQLPLRFEELPVAFDTPLLKVLLAPITAIPLRPVLSWHF